VSDLTRQTQGKETQGDYRPLQDIEATKQRLKENMKKQNNVLPKPKN
jgi:hypothetical protein